MYKLIIILVFFLPVFSSLSQDVSWDSSQAGNPIVPGHFADPSLVEMDGKYYIYATTVSKFMEPMVWISEDLQRWEVQQLDITGKHLFWAPSMLKGDDGKYYLYYSSGFDFKCHLYVGETPTGPWDYKGKVEDGFDLQIYRDPNDGKVYGSSSDPSSRPRLVEFNSDVNNAGYLTEVIKEKSLEGPFFDYTEGSFIIYRDGWYYFMYSGGKCHAENYKIHQARSRDIWGPYEDAPNNPVMDMDPEKNIFGPGHHSVFTVNNDYFIAYHRQDFYFYPTCSERQLCIDKMEFDDQGWIAKITPTNKGVDFSEYFDDSYEGLTNVALGKNTTAGNISGSYNPRLATDGNFATFWKGSGHFSVDLGENYPIEKILPRFINYDYYMMFKILYSSDNQKWDVYYDRTDVARKAAVPVAQKKINARYVKIEFVRSGGGFALSELEVWSPNP